MFHSLYLRSESYKNEQRTPLIPSDIHELVEAGMSVVVQRSLHRIFSDAEYAGIPGVTLTNKEWFEPEFQEHLIVGIKELSDLSKLNHHTHMYFSHSFKGQEGSHAVLDAFSSSKSILYDFEFLTDELGTRVIAFGYFAGLVGAALGLQQFAIQPQGQLLGPLDTWNSFEELIASLPRLEELKIAIIGPSGRCGTGVQTVLNRMKLQATEFTREYPPTHLEDFDIVYNCIQLDESYSSVWITQNSIFQTPTTLIDISCDASKRNNPISVYRAATSWESPVVYPLPNLCIIAIDNLPSLLPRESSVAFSNQLKGLLLSSDTTGWERALNTYKKVSLFL